MNRAPDAPANTWNAAVRVVRTSGSAIAGWAARQSWGRLAAVSLCVLIAQNVLTDHVLHWSDEKEKVVTHHHGNTTQRTARMPADGAAGAVDDSADIHIDSNGLAVRHHRDPPAAAQAAAPSAAAPQATAPAGTAPANTPPAAASPPDASPPKTAAGATSTDDDDDSEDIEIRRRRTVGGWLRDILEGLVLLLITYRIGSKIVLRETAKSDARAAEAEASAAAAAEQARSAEAHAEREALRFQLAQAQLKTLQAQVEPHFLFNTLASVDYLIETDPVRASAMQKNLIAYLRAALPQMRDHSSQLGRECTLVQAYLDILKVRMEDRLKTVVEVPDGLRSAEFPPMLLQSLVENAIRHGLEPKAEGGEVRVTARVEDGSLVVQVIDTGMGLSASGGERPADSGVGLHNVAERLALLYPGRASFVLGPNQPAGAIATVRLPYRVTSPAAGAPMAGPGNGGRSGAASGGNGPAPDAAGSPA